MPPSPTQPRRLRPVEIALLILGALGLLFVVGLKYAWSRLAMTVDMPSMVGEQIKGSFRLERDLDGILSKGIGGACLIGNFADRLTPADATTKGVYTGACTPESALGKKQCNPNLPEGPGQKPGPTNPQKWEGYCIKDDQSGQGKCWYKPWDDPDDGLLCNTSGMNPGGTPWQVDIDHPTPRKDGFSVRTFYNRYTGGHPAQWRVSGRLFSTDRKTQADVFSDPICVAAPGGQQC